MSKPKIVIVKKPQITMMTNEENTQVSNWAFATYGRTATHSDDDMFTMLAGGNSDSYAVVWWPDRQLNTVKALQDAGYNIVYMPEDTQPPVEEFKFTHWPTNHKVVTQRFGANSSYYGQFGLPGHEGTDIRAYHNDPLYAVADGIVSERHEVETSHNYGVFVRIDHKDGYQTTYAHCASLANLPVGTAVSGGDVIAYADNTGNSNGSHLHLTLKKKPSNYPDRCGELWPYDIVDSDEYLKRFGDVTWLTEERQCEDVTPPPSGPTIDVHDYFIPSGQFGIKLVMQVGNGTQPLQLEKRASDTILRKGDGVSIDGKRYQDSESWRVTDTAVLKGVDTSDQANNGRDAYDLDWAQWIPRHVQIGATYHSTPTVRRFDRTNCQTISTTNANDYLHIKEVVKSWVSPANSSIVLPDVLVVEWRSGTPDLSTPPTETYYFCKNFSYVGWGNHFVNELPQGQANLTGALDCGQ